MALAAKRTAKAVSTASVETKAKRVASQTQGLTKRKIKQASAQRATMTPLESTEVTGFGVQATYRMLRAGTMPHIRVGMRFFIPRNALMRWLDASAEPLA